MVKKEDAGLMTVQMQIVAPQTCKQKPRWSPRGDWRSIVKH